MSTVTTARELITDSWTSTIDALEREMSGVDLPPGRPDCSLMFTELPGGGLRVTIVKDRETWGVSGWNGPLALSDGTFSYVQDFEAYEAPTLVRPVRDMLAAPAF